MWVEPVPEKPIWGMARKLKDDPFLKRLFNYENKPRFHLDKFLLWLFWIIMMGLFWYLCTIIPFKVMDKIMMVFFYLGILLVINIFLKNVCEIDIVDMLKI